MRGGRVREINGDHAAGDVFSQGHPKPIKWPVADSLPELLRRHAIALVINLRSLDNDRPTIDVSAEGEVGRQVQSELQLLVGSDDLVDCNTPFRHEPEHVEPWAFGSNVAGGADTNRVRREGVDDD